MFSWKIIKYKPINWINWATKPSGDLQSSRTEASFDSINGSLKVLCWWYAKQNYFSRNTRLLWPPRTILHRLDIGLIYAFSVDANTRFRRRIWFPISWKRQHCYVFFTVSNSRFNMNNSELTVSSKSSSACWRQVMCCLKHSRTYWYENVEMSVS